jgi:hypothetical protein
MPDRSLRLTRRIFCASPCALALPAIAGAPSLAEDVATYVSFGEHRAGMPSEARTANWMQERLAQMGYQTDLQKFPIPTILNPGGYLVAAGSLTDLFPQWFAPAASLGKMIEAPLQLLNAPAGLPSIRVVPKPVAASGNWGPAQDALVQEAAGKGAVGLLMAAEVKSGDVYAFNQHTTQALPIPVALLAQRMLPALVAIAERGDATAQMTLMGDLTDTQSINVVARKAGRGRMLVISTPMTGWFHCGAERGPGVAMALRIASMLAQSKRPVLVLCTGSHEIGHAGMAHALKNGAPDPADVAFWFHFGASLGAIKLDAQYGVTSPQFVVGTPTSEVWVRSAMASSMRGYANGNSATPGEAGQVMGAGHLRFAGMIGTFPGFHTPGDRGEAIDYAQLEKIAQASETLIARMDALPD